MFAKVSFISAAFAVAAQLASAQAPPACLLAAVNTNENPADKKAICNKSNEMGEKLVDMCGGNLDAAQKSFNLVCKNAGVAVTLSGSPSSSGKIPYPTGNGSVVYAYSTTYYDDSCSCSKTTELTGTAYVGTGMTTATGAAGNGSSQATPTGSSGSGGSGSSGSSGSSGTSGGASTGTGAGAATQTGAASHYQLAGLSLGAVAVAGLAVAL